MVNDSGIAKDGFAVKPVSFIARGYYSGCPLDSSLRFSLRFSVKIAEDNYSCYGEQSKTVAGVIASLLEINNRNERNFLSYGCYNLVCSMSISDCKPWQGSECSSRFLKFDLNEMGEVDVGSFTCFDMP